MVFLIALFMSVASAAETRQRVIVLDSGVPMYPHIREYMCEDGHKDYTDSGIEDVDGHGTNVAGIIATWMDKKKQCLVILKWYHTKKHHINRFTDVYADIEALRPAYLNLSLNGPARYIEEHAALRRLVQAGTIIVVAAGNDGKNLTKECDAYPACYPMDGFRDKYYVVANHNGVSYAPSSNRYGPVNAYMNGNNVRVGNISMSGTSQSAALWTGELIRRANGGKH
jgi:subtilisin family serine protease